MASSLITQGVQFPDGTIMSSTSEYERVITINSANTAVDLSASSYATFIKANVGASSTITFSNAPNAANTVYSFTLMTVNTGPAYTLAFGNSVKWPYGIQPARTTATGAIDIWTFFLEANTYYGSLSMANVS
jgi:hypothetical protein